MQRAGTARASGAPFPLQASTGRCTTTGGCQARPVVAACSPGCRAGPPPMGKKRSALTKPHGPPPRQVAAIVLRRPEKRSTERRAYRTQRSAADPVIATTTELADDVLVMLRQRVLAES